ncbi:TetR/AcrR family transcriptional regulator [Kineosporia rhizophila]|uniref:TetR/AcrR family transcriptional regulator n=1 Tax=Kineosporia TaxID=49184 RepID=UPI001E620402|nr:MULTISPECIES: TetR/AcrR family transcriptional regulator [Kineosporia]MCE0539727.1 TetR/AcrR family transcriptional regulator [Kineosporia rhizophila]GLY16377.1 TetR family transcriptional regulator [Kineosporia sp. NBRC 101677]
MDDGGGGEAVRVPGLRERRKVATRKALVHAALSLIADYGFEHVTVEAISESAGVSQRTFFNYFATKEDALVSDQADEAARLCERVRAAPPELSALAALRYGLVHEVEQIEHHPEVFALRMKVLERNPELFPRLMASSETALANLADVIAERVRVPADHAFPGLLAFVGASAFHATLRRWHQGGRAGEAAVLVAETFDLLAAGFPDPAPQEPDPAIAIRSGRHHADGNEAGPDPSSRPTP